MRLDLVERINIVLLLEGKPAFGMQKFENDPELPAPSRESYQELKSQASTFVSTL